MDIPVQTYDGEFFASLQEGARRSAQEIVPLVLQLTACRSVVDVGCGDGTWLRVFHEHGMQRILGVDGEWVNPTMLQIQSEQFVRADLTRPLKLCGSFDLAVSLEVAEHLPSRCADTFISSLTGLAPVVLFSAAVPFQGGTHHVNEQWPEYWVDRFAARGYVPIDCVRTRIWQNENVEWWYAQNTLMFACSDHVATDPLLRDEFEKTSAARLSLVHPRLYQSLLHEASVAVRLERGPAAVSLREILSLLPSAFGRACRRRVTFPRSARAGSRQR